jgi:hypothetical protein
MTESRRMTESEFCTCGWPFPSRQGPGPRYCVRGHLDPADDIQVHPPIALKVEEVSPNGAKRPLARSETRATDEPDDTYRLEPLDWQGLIAQGIPPIDYLDEPYLIRGARTWVWGPTGTSKSIYALWLACKLTRSGHRVAYFSEENPTTEDLRRLGLLVPDPEHLLFFHRSGIDLTDPAWIRAMLDATAGCTVVALDTWTDCWHGDENSNEDVRDFDATVLKPLQAQGATPFVVHHTGHPQMFTNRKGATAGRGASSLGQKADVTLEFRAEEHRQFTIVYGKPRIGGQREPDRTLEVVDTVTASAPGRASSQP